MNLISLKFQYTRNYEPFLIKSHTKFQEKWDVKRGSCIFSNGHLNLRSRMWWQIEIPDCSSGPLRLNKLLNYRSMIYICTVREQAALNFVILGLKNESWTRSLDSNGLSYLRYLFFLTTLRYWKIFKDTFYFNKSTFREYFLSKELLVKDKMTFWHFSL